MEVIEVFSWKTLEAIKQASHVLHTIGNPDPRESKSIFCSIEEDFFELNYNQLENSFIRHFQDEEEMFKYLDIRKHELSLSTYDLLDYKPDIVTDSFTGDTEDEE